MATHASARTSSPVQSSQEGASTEQADRLAALRDQVPVEWAAVLGSVREGGPPPTEPILATVRLATYRLLIDRRAGYDAFAAYLGADPSFGPYRRAAEQVADGVARDRDPLAQLDRSIANVAAGMVERDVHPAALAAYVRLSATGRRYVRELRTVTSLADGPVKQLLLGQSPLVPLAPPDAPAAETAAQQVDPAIEEAYNGLRRRILDEDPNDRAPAARERRDQLERDVRAADGRVLDRLRADTETSLKIAALTRPLTPGAAPGASYDLALATDSVYQLHWRCNDLPDEAAQFAAIKTYLEQRPGPDNQAVRARVMQNQYLMNRIAGFTADHQNQISRLIARGTLARGPMDILQDAAHGQVAAAGALRAAIELARDPSFPELRANGMFRQTIESGANRQVTTVDGLTTSVHDFVLRLWGQAPAGTGDAESGLPQDAVNPTQDLPPSPEEMAQLNALFPPTINALAGELDDFWGVNNAFMVSTLTAFETRCADPANRRLFERARMHPGAELVRRCHADSRIGDIRARLRSGVDEESLQVCERVLGIRVDAATVGRIDGQVQLADQQMTQTSGTVPLAQALRSTQVSPSTPWASGAMTVSQVLRNAATAMAEKLNEWHLWGGCAGRDITQIFTQLTGVFSSQITVQEPAGQPGQPAGATQQVQRPLQGELQRQTGIGRIHPIELLVNAFHEVPGGGDLSGKINERVEEDDRANTLRSLGLDAGSVRERNRVAEPPAPGRFVEPARVLYEALTQAQQGSTNDDSQLGADEQKLRRAGEAWQRARALDGSGDGAAAMPGAPAAAAVPAPAQPAETFTGTYRREYGIEPARHVVEIGRTAAALEGTSAGTRAQIAGWLHVAPEALTSAVRAPAAQLPEATASGFTRAQAQDAANRIWTGVRAGDVVPIRAQLEGRRPEERELIEACFRELSGGIDLAFYVRQAQQVVADRTQNTFQVGMEGVHAEGEAQRPDLHARPHDAASWTEALDVVQTGAVGILTRVRTALANSDRNEIFRIADEATPADRRTILGDEATMGQIRQTLSGVDFDRVYATLAGTADLALRLASRSEGDVSGTVTRFFSSTDTEGMRRDIRQYAARRREHHTRRYEDEGRDPQAPATQALVQQAVRDDLLRAYDNPQVRSIIDQEFGSWWSSDSAHETDSTGSELEGMLLNSGQADGLASLTTDGVAWSSDILTQVRQMPVEQRRQHRANPELLRRVWERCTNQLNRRLIMLALESDEPAGEDHIGAIVESFNGSATTLREQVARLSQGELARLRSQPDLVAEISGRLTPDEQTRFRALIALDTAGSARMIGATAVTRTDAAQPAGPQAAGAQPAAAPPMYQLGDREHPVPGEINEAEVQRLAFLRAQCAQRLVLGAGNSWIRLLREAVEVFRADLKPQLQPTPPSEEPPAPGAAQRPPDLTAAARAYEERMRRELWTEVQGTVSPVAQGHDADGATGEQIVERAVKKVADPSDHILREDLHWYGNEHEDIEATIQRASPEHVMNHWSSVKRPKWPGEGGESLEHVYQQFRTARETAQGEAASPAAAASAQRLQRSFQRYVVEPSYDFEGILLPNTGGMLADRDRTSRARQQLDRDNPNYARYRRAINERIRSLDASQVATAIGATGADAAIVGSRLRGALTDFSVAEEIYAHHRGDGQGSFAQDEGRQLDRSFGDYRREVGRAEDAAGTTGDIEDRQRRELARLDEGMRDRAGEYQAAREEAATIAATVVGTIAALIVTALTAGAATPLAMAMYGALTSAAAASGEVMTREMILGRTHDASGEGVRTIASAAATGFIAAGSQYYAGRLTSGMLGSAASQAEQGRLITEMAAHSPPRWQQMLHAGGRTMVQGTMTGLVETAGSSLSPTVWSHGWDEGWIRATDRARDELRSRPIAILRSTLTAMIGASVGNADSTGEAVRPGERLGLGRTLGQAADDMPSTLISTAADVGIGVTTGEVRSARQALGQLGTGVAQSVRETGTGMHEGSVHRAQATTFANDQMREHPQAFASEHERALYMAAVENSLQQGDPPTAAEFASARDAFAASVARRSPDFGALSPDEQARFLAWVREAPSTEEFQVRMRRNPREVIAERTATGGAPAQQTPPLDRVRAAQRELHEIAGRSLASEDVTAADASARTSQGEADRARAAELEQQAQAAVADAQRQLNLAEAQGAPNLEALRRDLRDAQAALQDVHSTAAQVRLSAAAAARNAQAAPVTMTLTPGAAPPEGTSENHARVIAEANRLFTQLNPATAPVTPESRRFLSAETARIAWADYLRRHGINVPGHETVTDTARDMAAPDGGGVTEVEGHPLIRGRQEVGRQVGANPNSVIAGDAVSPDSAVAREFHDQSRAPNRAGVTIETAQTALAQLVAGGAIPGARNATGRGFEVVVRTSQGETRTIRIEIIQPADADGAVAQSNYGREPDRVQVWVSDRILDEQVPRALGGIIHDVIARVAGSRGADAQRAGMHGQLHALFARLIDLQTAPPAAPTGDAHAQAMAQGRTETAGRVRAELDLLLTDMGLMGPGASRQAALEAIQDPALRRLVQEHIEGPRTVRFDADAAARHAETRREAPAPSATDLAVTNGTAQASSVLPGPPTGDVRGFSAEDYPRIMELRMHFEAIREMDQRLAGRDMAGAARRDQSPAVGESLRRREHVERVRALLGELQIGGTNQEFIRARLAELEAVFPGSSDIASEVQTRVDRRVRAVDAHQRAEAFRHARAERQAQLIREITGRQPFTTDRTIVGGGMAGTSRAAALGVAVGQDGRVDPHQLLMLGGDDMISTWEPAAHWGQRAGVFENSDHPMFRGATDGNRLGDVVEDQGEFMHVGELNDAMDLARERLGLVNVPARVQRVEVAQPGTPWPDGVDANAFPVRLVVQITGGPLVTVYAKHSDITTGLGNTAMPNEGILDPTSRDALLRPGENGAPPVVMGGERMMSRDAPALRGRVLVVAFGPTGAWAAYRAAAGGATHIDWAGTGSIESNLASLQRTAGIDRTQDVFSGRPSEAEITSRIHSTADQILHIERDGGGGALVTYVTGGNPPRTYQQHYDHVLMTQGFDSAARTPGRDAAAPSADAPVGDNRAGSILRDMNMQVQQGTDLPNIENEGPHAGAVTVYAGAAWDGAGMEQSERAELAARQRAMAGRLSADSPDARTMESMGHSVDDDEAARSRSSGGGSGGGGGSGM